MNPYNIYIAEYTCNRSRREREAHGAGSARVHGPCAGVSACMQHRPREPGTCTAASTISHSERCLPGTQIVHMHADRHRPAGCCMRTAGRGAVPAVRALPQPTTRRTQPQSARATTDAREPAGELAGAGGTLLNCRLQPADVRRRSRRLAGPGRGPRPRAACSVLHVNAAVQCRRPWPVGRALVTQVTRRPADACVVSIRSPSLPRARSLSPRTSGLGVPG
jgi:hypothetical protein